MLFVGRGLRRATSRPRATLSPPIGCLKNSTGLQSCRRPFHASSRRLIINECLGATHTLITGLHGATGLPWAAALPLTAVLIRLTIIGPVAAYCQMISRRRVEIFPLLHAWHAAISRNVFRAHGPEGPEACEKIMRKAVREKGVVVRKTMGVQYWKSTLSWIQLPIFLVVIDTIRSMCGHAHGLLGLIVRGSAREETTIEEEFGQELSQISTGPFYEPSLATEGALWFPDLLVPDPALVLPFILSTSLLATMYSHERRAKIANIPIGKWQSRLQRTLKVLALAIAPATLGVPSGILVYWISSTWCALGQHALLDWYFPTKPAIKPCEPKKFAKTPKPQPAEVKS